MNSPGLQKPSVHQAFPFFKRKEQSQALADEDLKILRKKFSHNIPQERYR
jgi:hypothetical protein